MPILPPLNDRQCLDQYVEQARAFMQTPEARALVTRLDSLADLLALIDSLDYRPDTGDPSDGPRVACDVSQRLRVPAWDPNCSEATTMFMGLAPLIEPDIRVSCATLQLDEGLHTFPVIFEDDRVYPVVLNPGSAPPRNVMVAALYDIRNTSPATRKNVGPWFVEMATNVCEENGMDDVYERAMETLRNALLTGEPIEDPEDIEYLFSLTEPEAALFGNLGRAAHERVRRSVRNLALALDKKRVRKMLAELVSTAGPLAADAVKVALIAKFGPAAEIALHGVNLDQAEIRDESDDDELDDEEPKTARRARKRRRTSRREISPDQRRREMHRLALAFRNPEN